MIVTNRLSEKIEQALNVQVTKEAHAAQLYLSYGAWAHKKGFSGIGNFLFRHSAEERNHMMKIVEYILNRGGEVKIVAIPPPNDAAKTITDCFEKIFEHEVENTISIYGLVSASFNEADWATWNFMQWFVKEQIEEETLAADLLDKIKIAGGEQINNNALYSLDKDLGKVQGDASTAEEATTEKP